MRKNYIANNEIWDIDKLSQWEKNPKAVKKEDFKRVLKQIQNLGQYKPLLITKQGTVLGGNTRLMAYKALGISKVWVSIVEPKNEQEKVEYALSDNDEVGQYVKDELAELVSHFPDLDKDLFKVNLGKSKSLDDLFSEFGPDTDSALEYQAEYQVVIKVRSEEEQHKLYKKLSDDGYDVEVLTI